ncbi:MAG TPA: radical SAM protein [Kofleriaceae bacterium]|nr:radical SAM protein [Kofleriaceae bacterium]
MVSLYIINPSSDFPTYFSADVLAATGRTPGALIADLAIATLAAFAPPDFGVTLCDENAGPVDFEVDADWIAITGKVNQRQRMIAIAGEFRRRGRRVVIGGPYASLSPDVMRPHCDVLVRGEIEDIHEQFFADLRAGSPREEYIGDRPDLARSPVPRWDLYPSDQAMMGSIQTSRGCPFECEFCDVIQYLGRKQRHKPIAQVLAELDVLAARGHRSAFVADDNFTASRRRAKELLEAMASWRVGKDLALATQVSIDSARDDELLGLCASAGITQVFIGIETPNPESLRETKKRQNLNVDLAAQVDRFVEHGIAVIGGMIVGFDADGLDIFQRQYEFAMSSAIPLFTLGALVAPDATPLHARMEAEGRLLRGGPEVQAVPWSSNIVPKQMTAEQLDRGLRSLCGALYAPAAFGERVLRFIDRFPARPPIARADATPARAIDAAVVEVAMGVRRLGPEEQRMWYRVWAAVARRPETAPTVTGMLFHYAQIRHLYARGTYWEPQLATELLQQVPIVSPPPITLGRRPTPSA